STAPTFVLHANDSTRIDAKAERRGEFYQFMFEHQVAEIPSPLRLLLWQSGTSLFGRMNNADESSQPFAALMDSAGSVTASKSDSSAKGATATKIHYPEPWDSLKIFPYADLGRIHDPDGSTSPSSPLSPSSPRMPANWLIREATVWTSSASGKLENTDVAIINGKIAAIGPKLDPKVHFKELDYRTIYA
ncbi:MAG: hypothetical protein ACKO9W_06010, partial [Bacteroidota bacterium]